MSVSNGWFTKEDVLKDLTEVTGNQVTNFVENYIVSGERPPPPWSNDEEIDEEIHSQLYGRECDFNLQDKDTGPDLQGITCLLQMVKEYNDLPDYGLDVQPVDEDPCENVISISKLNPNVKEFVPKSAIELNSCSVVSEETIEKENKNTDLSNVKNSNSNDIDKEFKTANLKSEHINDISKRLKAKIHEASKDNCLKKKRDKNVAIVTLLKLHSTAPPDIDHPKLLTPQYFETPPCSNPCNTNVESGQDLLENKNRQENQNNDNTNTSNESTPNVVSIENVKYDKIKQSINKVNSWLEKPSTKSPVPILGAVTFKKRDVSSNSPNKIGENNDVSTTKLPVPLLGAVTCKKRDVSSNSPNKIGDNNDVSTTKSPVPILGAVTFKKKDTCSNSPNKILENNKILKTPAYSSSYVPSQYAQDLYKKYTEQEKAKDKPVDIWTDLEKKLRIKDEQIKEKLKQNSSQISSERCDDNQRLNEESDESS